MAEKGLNRKEKENMTEGKPFNKGYLTECIVLGALALVYSFALIRAVNPLFFLCLLFPTIVSALLSEKRNISAGLCAFFAAASFCTGISNMKTMWENKYVFLPGILMIFVNALLILLFRKFSLKSGKDGMNGILLISAAASLIVICAEAFRYRVPENIFTYFSTEPFTFSNVIKRLAVSSQASLGFLIPGAVFTFLLLMTGKKKVPEKASFLLSAAIIAFVGGFLGFFGYKDMASPVILLAVSAALFLSDFPEEKNRLPVYIAEAYLAASCFYDLLRRVME